MTGRICVAKPGVRMTILNVFSVANGVLRHGVKAGHLTINPAATTREDLVKTDDDATERRPLTAAQVKAFAALLPPTFRPGVAPRGVQRPAGG